MNWPAAPRLSLLEVSEPLPCWFKPGEPQHTRLLFLSSEHQHSGRHLPPAAGTAWGHHPHGADIPGEEGKRWVGEALPAHLSHGPHLSSPSLQGCYFCVKQFALECSRIPMGQAVNSQVCVGDRVIWSGQRAQTQPLPLCCVVGTMVS